VVALDRWAGTTIRLRFTARDADADALIEAALDDIRIYRVSPTTLRSAT
jgi:hypothetical protein